MKIVATEKVRRFTQRELESALREASAWSEEGYSPESRAYWQGMRDTLRVLTGYTTKAPNLTTDDAAATILFTRKSSN